MSDDLKAVWFSLAALAMLLLLYRLGQSAELPQAPPLAQAPPVQVVRQALPSAYKRAYDLAMSEGKPLVVFVGCWRIGTYSNLPRCVAVSVDSYRGSSTPRIVVSAVQDDGCLYEQGALPADASWSDIRQLAGTLPVPQQQTFFAAPQEQAFFMPSFGGFAGCAGGG